MDASEFYQFVWSLKDEGSRTTKEEMIADFVDQNAPSVWKAGITMIAGQRFSNNGVAPTTAKKAFVKAFAMDEERVADEETDAGTVTLAVERLLDEDGVELTDESIVSVVEKLETVADLSGDAQVSRLANVFATSYAPLVAFGVLTDDLAIGVTRKTIAKAVAGDYSRAEIERARGLIPDSVEFVEYVQSGEVFPPEVTVGRPFEPMKANSKDLPADVDDWAAQLKIDGFRLLIHVSGSEVKAFTRNMEDVTYSIPELDEIDWPVGEFIFDCEAIAYDDGEAKGYRATSERIGRKHDISSFTTDIHFEAFDCIYANRDISDEPFSHRFDLLESYFPSHEYTRILSVISDLSEAQDMAEKGGYEGVIAKDMTAPYKFDKRSNFWRKLKLTDETVDLTVVGFEVGSGNDAGTLGRMELETADGEFVGYVGNGWTDAEQEEIWNNQEKYYGQVAEIWFEGFDKKLRFPVFQNWRPHGEADSLERLKEIGNTY